MQITQCLHTAILVSELEKAEKFYGQVLALPKIERVLKFAGAWYQIGDHQIHLILNPEVKPKIYDDEKWGRNAHIAFSVTDLDEAKQRLQANGHPIQLSSSGRAALFTQDPDGNVIEISQLVSG